MRGLWRELKKPYALDGLFTNAKRESGICDRNETEESARCGRARSFGLIVMHLHAFAMENLLPTISCRAGRRAGYCVKQSTHHLSPAFATRRIQSCCILAAYHIRPGCRNNCRRRSSYNSVRRPGLCRSSYWQSFVGSYGTEPEPQGGAVV